MASLEDLLKEDDQNFGSFGTLEKGVGYTTLFCVTIPVVSTPFLFTVFHKSIFKVTAFLLGFIFSLYLVLLFRFSWIVWLNNYLRQLYA